MEFVVVPERTAGTNRSQRSQVLRESRFPSARTGSRDIDKKFTRSDGVTSTPTFFVDGMRYDDAWDFHSMLEALRRPIAAQLHRSARAFANLPASAGLSLLLAALAALICANSPIAPYYK